jgi:hypothetical protein
VITQGSALAAAAISHSTLDTHFRGKNGLKQAEMTFYLPLGRAALNIVLGVGCRLGLLLSMVGLEVWLAKVCVFFSEKIYSPFAEPKLNYRCLHE